MHFRSTDWTATLPPNYTFKATLKTAGTQSLTATDTAAASLTATQGNITVNPAAASKFLLSAPSSATAGTSFSLTVTAEDAYGNVATGYTGTVHFTSSDGQAALPADYTFTPGDGGVHTFTVTLKTAGSQTVTATDTASSSITGQASLTVNPAAASTMTVAGFPSPTTAGVSHTFTVTL